jgi:uncharacterized protein
VQIAIAIALGLGIGIVVGAIGGGGAILALPVFVYVLGEGVSSASTASLIVVTLGASAGAGAHAVQGRVCWRVAAYARGTQKVDQDGARRLDFSQPELPRSGASGLVVGVMTGFFGVGGGFLVVPALTSLLGLPLRRAIATSLAVIGFTGLAALGVHLGRGAEPDWPLTIALSGEGMFGHRHAPQKPASPGRGSVQRRARALAEQRR